MANPRILAGQNAAITGGARGIGRATAQALLRQGMKVAIGDIDEELARRTASELGDNAIGLPLDVTDRASFTAFLDEAERELGPLDVLVNNAGIMPLNHFLDEDDATARRIMDINVHGVILGTKLALERMVPRDRGHIVNIASQAGKMGTPGGATYSASKHAVIGLTESVRGELRLSGSHVDLTYVMPVVVQTELGSGLPENRVQRSVQPDDVADAIVAALRHGLVDVSVPRSVKHLNRLSAMVPRSIAEGFIGLTGADRVLYDPDPSVRHDYELRVATPAGELEAAPEAPELAAPAKPRARRAAKS